jgi:hypothetical protein
LHLIQHGYNNPRGGWLQIEWYNDEGFELPYSFKFKDNLDVGDIKLQNPFVGHSPIQMWSEQDFINIRQTCKFHNFVKPGINIVTEDFKKITATDDILLKFKQVDPKFVELHGEDMIRHYIGYPVIGHIENINDLNQLIQDTSVLVFDGLDFEDFPNTSGV